MYDYLIVGAVLFGAVFTQQVKAQGKKVLERSVRYRCLPL